MSEPFGRAFRIPSDLRSACARIGEFNEQARERILAEGRAPSLLVESRLYDNIVALKPADNGLRQPWGESGEIMIDKPLSARFTLVIRANGMFAALLPWLNASFPCLAVVRNPLAVLASWQTVNLPVHRGRVPGAEKFDRDLHRTLEQEPEVLRRQIIVLNWFFARFEAHLPPGNLVRYEDMVESGGLALFHRLGHARAQPVFLKSQNDNALYDRVMIDTLLKALLETDGSWTRFYSPSDCEQVADRIRHGR